MNNKILLFHFCCNHEVFLVSPYCVWSIDMTRTKKERIEISLLLTFVNFCHKILHLDSLDLWLRVAGPPIQIRRKGEVSQRKHSWPTLNSCLSFSCTCLVSSIMTFIFKVVTLIFFVLVGYESGED